MLSSIPPSATDVAEIMCGNGAASQYILTNRPGVRVVGYDISAQACAEFTRKNQAPATVLDVTSELLPTDEFDAIIVNGGLHHTHRYLDVVLSNVSQALRPGGVLCMMEPNSNYFLEPFRRIWYKVDDQFDSDNESAIDHDVFFEAYSSIFSCIEVKHMGGPAYFLIYNSMQFRLPAWVKSWLAPPLFSIEGLWNSIPQNNVQAFFLSQWKKR